MLPAPPLLRLCYDLTCSKPLQTLICYDLGPFSDTSRGGEYRTPKQLRLGKNFPMGTTHNLIVLLVVVVVVLDPLAKRLSLFSGQLSPSAASSPLREEKFYPCASVVEIRLRLSALCLGVSVVNLLPLFGTGLYTTLSRPKIPKC